MKERHQRMNAPDKWSCVQRHRSTKDTVGTWRMDLACWRIEYIGRNGKWWQTPGRSRHGSREEVTFGVGLEGWVGVCQAKKREEHTSGGKTYTKAQTCKCVWNIWETSCCCWGSAFKDFSLPLGGFRGIWTCLADWWGWALWSQFARGLHWGIKAVHVHQRKEGWGEQTHICLTGLYMQTSEILQVPDHCNKANMTIKHITQIFCFPSAYESYVYTILYSIKCATPLCLKKTMCIP